MSKTEKKVPKGLGPQISRARRHLVKLNEHIMNRVEKSDPTALPSVNENEERATRRVNSIYDSLLREAANKKPNLIAEVAVSLMDVPIDELKARMAADKEKEKE